MTLSTPYTGSQPLYVVIRSIGGLVWNGADMVPWEDTELAQYAIPLSPKGGDLWAAPVPAALPDGAYLAQYYRRENNAPEVTDLLLRTDSFTPDPAQQVHASAGIIPVSSARSTLVAYANSGARFMFTAMTAAGEPANLAGRSVRFLARRRGESISVIDISGEVLGSEDVGADGMVTVTVGDAEPYVVIGMPIEQIGYPNRVLIELQPSHTVAPGLLLWTLRDQTGQRSLATGYLEIISAHGGTV